jgi:hypothetical protein
MKTTKASNRIAGGMPVAIWGEADTDVGSAMASFESGHIASQLTRFDREHHG